MEDLKYSDRRKYLQYPLNGNIYYFFSGGMFSSEIKAKILRVFVGKYSKDIADSRNKKAK